MEELRRERDQAAAENPQPNGDGAKRVLEPPPAYDPPLLAFRCSAKIKTSARSERHDRTAGCDVRKSGAKPRRDQVGTGVAKRCLARP